MCWRKRSLYHSSVSFVHSFLRDNLGKLAGVAPVRILWGERQLCSARANETEHIYNLECWEVVLFYFYVNSTLTELNELSALGAARPIPAEGGCHCSVDMV